MYPFKILIVKKDQGFLYRVVYQQNQTINITVDGVCIVCSAIPELAMWDDHGSIYLRGYQSHEDHSVRLTPLRTKKEYLMSLNDKLKLML
jgi:hypothetical protein